jgi:hypothetical protein
VRDLLKTAARQAAGFLAQMHATEALLEARKFDAFNKMSAFVVHDLKNIITQLSLMMKNAERHRDNPEFQADMLMTVESSLEKMRQMMLQLREGAKPTGVASGVDLVPLLQRPDVVLYRVAMHAEGCGYLRGAHAFQQAGGDTTAAGFGVHAASDVCFSRRSGTSGSHSQSSTPPLCTLTFLPLTSSKTASCVYWRKNVSFHVTVRPINLRACAAVIPAPSPQTPGTFAADSPAQARPMATAGGLASNLRTATGGSGGSPRT